MDVASVSSAILGKLFDKSPAGGAASEPTDDKSPAASLSAGGKAQQARDILAQYDIRNITPREFSELAQKLHQAGVITSNDLQDLSQLRLDLDSSQVQPDQSINLLDFVASKLLNKKDELEDLKLQSPYSPQAKDPDGFLAVPQRQFNWVRKFADIQSGVASPSVDRVA